MGMVFSDRAFFRLQLVLLRSGGRRAGHPDPAAMRADAAAS
jgi:hypothetical protein